MKTLHSLAAGAAGLMASAAALAQSGHMMDGGFMDGWMGGYGGIWVPILLAIAVLVIVVMVINRK